MILRRHRVLGFLIFSIGLGILLAVSMPVVGWIILSGIALMCLGIYFLKH